MTTVVGIEEKLLESAKMASRIIDTAISANASSMTSLAEAVTKTIDIASITNNLAYESASSRLLAGVAARIENPERDYLGLAHDRVGEFFRREQELISSRGLAEMHEALIPKESLLRALDAITGSQTIGQAIGAFNMDLAPQINTASAISTMLDHIGPSWRLNDGAYNAFLDNIDKDVLLGVNPIWDNASSALLASVNRSLESTHSGMFAIDSDSLDRMRSIVATSFMPPPDDLRDRFADIIAGSAIPANYTTFRFELPEYRFPFTTPDRSGEREQPTVRVPKPSVYVEVEPTHQTISTTALKESLAERLWALVRAGIVTAFQAVEYYRMLDNEPELLHHVLADHTPKPIRRGKKSHYTEEQQRQIVMGSFTTDLKQWQYAQKFGVDDSVIRRWKKKFKIH